MMSIPGSSVYDLSEIHYFISGECATYCGALSLSCFGGRAKVFLWLVWALRDSSVVWFTCSEVVVVGLTGVLLSHRRKGRAQRQYLKENAMLNMVWGSVTAYMSRERLNPLVKDLRAAFGPDSQVKIEVNDLEVTGRDIYSVRFMLNTTGDVSESSIMDAVRAISQSESDRSDGHVYFMDTRSMSVNNSPTITLYDLSRSIYPVVETDYGVYADVHSFLEFGETIVTDF